MSKRRVKCWQCGAWFDAEVSYGREGSARVTCETGTCQQCGAPYFSGWYGCSVLPIADVTCANDEALLTQHTLEITRAEDSDKPAGDTHNER